MELGKGFATGCRSATGDLSDVNRTSCRAFNGNMCKFDSGFVFNITVTGVVPSIDPAATGISFDRCIFLGQGETRVEMTYVCLTSDFTLSTCANNCLGVEASDIVAGGAAILAVATATSVLPVYPALVPLLGVGGLGLAGAGVMAMMSCLGPFFCVTIQGNCCLVVFDILNGISCPNSC